MKKGTTALKRKRGHPNAPLPVSLLRVGSSRRKLPANLAALPSRRAAPDALYAISPPPLSDLMPCQPASVPTYIGGGWSLLVQEMQSVGNVQAVAWQRDSCCVFTHIVTSAAHRLARQRSLPPGPAFSLTPGMGHARQAGHSRWHRPGRAA